MKLRYVKTYTILGRQFMAFEAEDGRRHDIKIREPGGLVQYTRAEARAEAERRLTEWLEP